MVEEVEKCSVKSIPFQENTSIVKEEIDDYGFPENKIFISEIAINTNSIHLQEHVNHHSINSVKIEEGFGVDNIKTELRNELLFCEQCQAYYEDYCTKCNMLVHILNKNTLSNVDNGTINELPNDYLEIQLVSGHYGIFALKDIPKDVKFGPFAGVYTSEGNWKVNAGKFTGNENISTPLNWMKYINPAKNIFEQSLQPVQYDGELYFQSSRNIQIGEELLVYFGEQYEDCVNENIQVDFVPVPEEPVVKDVFACTFCCLGFNSSPHLLKHKTLCRNDTSGKFSIEELTQCSSCNIYLGEKEYYEHHMDYCCNRSVRKCIPLASDDQRIYVSGCKKHQYRMESCSQCNHNTNYTSETKCKRLQKRRKSIKAEQEEVRNQSGDQLSSQDSEKLFKCSQCEFRTKFKYNLNVHVKDKHLKELRYKCGLCPYKANRKHGLEEHMKTKHLREFKYKCEVCEYGTNRSQHLEVHTKSKHLKEYDYECEVCNYKTNIKAYLEAHIKTKHTKDFDFKCDKCAYTTNYKTDLEKHKKNRHAEKFDYNCDFCTYGTNIKSHLEIHRKNKHLKEYDFKCELCPYTTNLKPDLQTHTKTKHLDQFDYRCEMCTYKTNRRSYLENHKRSKHLEEFDYKCEICAYKTNRKSYFQMHLKNKHLQEFDYKCDMCAYKSNYRLHLQKHKETKHLEEFGYKCDICPYMTNYKGDLRKHKERKHIK